MSIETVWLDATAQAELVRRREVAPVELVEAAIARVEAMNPRLNAVITPLFDEARRQAASASLPDGSFRGVPMLLKDLDSYCAGAPYHAGMGLLRDVGWVAPHDSHLVGRFRSAGFIFLGKTNVPELGLVPTTEPVAFGPTRNPWDPVRSPGGSSGGSAAAVAAGLVPVAHASDGGGSIRIPASACGLVGLKPSRGRTSLGPDNHDVWSGLTVEHVVTRSIRDSAAILDAVAGLHAGDSYCAPRPARPFRDELTVDSGRLRIGVMTGAPAGGIEVHPDCVTAAEDAARLLESLGHTLEPAHPQALDESEFGMWFGQVIASWTARALEHWSAVTGRKIGVGDVEASTWALAEMGRAVSAVGYVEAITWLRSYGYRMAQWWTGFDLLLTPTMAEPPPPLGQLHGTPDNPMNGLLRAIPLAVFTSPFNATGQPALSLPIYWNEAQLPIGVQLVAAYAREDLLLRVGAQLEQARPWAHRLPAIHA